MYTRYLHFVYKNDYRTHPGKVFTDRLKEFETFVYHKTQILVLNVTYRCRGCVRRSSEIAYIEYLSFRIVERKKIK